MTHLLRTDLGGTLPAGRGTPLLSLLLMSDVQVMDSVSPARCEWVELLGDDPRWQPLLHMHRPYEALTHWAFAAHIDKAARDPTAPCGRRAYDLCLCLGDNIDNAQHNELDAFLAILAGGRARLSAVGGVHDASGAAGPGPWPYWCPDARVDDRWKARGYPAVPDFIERAGSALVSNGLGFPWACLPGNHDLMRQGTALPGPAIERIATGSHKALHRPAGFDPADPQALFVEQPALFSAGSDRLVEALATRRALDQREWMAALTARGAVGCGTAPHAAHSMDTVIDTEHVRIILLDTNHPAGDYQGSIGAAQLEWLDARLAEVDADPGRIAVLCSHHGSVSLTNTRGGDPQRLQADALVAVVHRHACVASWLVGHRHLHQIQSHPGPCGGFWEISTGSVIDWPSQTRSLELIRHGNGTLEIATTLLDHGAAPGSLADLHHQLARRFAGDQAARMQGAPGDGDVRLLRPDMYRPEAWKP